MTTLSDLTVQYLSGTSGTIHADKDCSINRRRQVGNMAISERQAQTIIEHPEWYKICTKCH